MCRPNDTLLCFNDDSSFANGVTAFDVNPSADAVLGQIDRTTTRSVTTGATVQANQYRSFSGTQPVSWWHQLRLWRQRFVPAAELGTIGPNYVVSARGYFGPSGTPFRSAPVRFVHQPYTGLYAQDTFDVTDGFQFRAAPVQLCKHQP